jgi:putative DNA primase/helicase
MSESHTKVAETSSRYELLHPIITASGTILPAKMRAQDRWICWTRHKGRKVPCGPRTCGMIDATDPHNWADFATAMASVEDEINTGLGFVFGGGTVGIDLDDCRDPGSGKLTSSAQAIVDRIKSYTEVSPSRRGVKIFLLAESDVNRRTRGTEVYGSHRFFTVTGEHVAGTPDDLQERTEELSRLCTSLFGSTPSAGATKAWLGQRGCIDPTGGDDDLLECARGAGNGRKFEVLFAGLWRGRYPSQSEADLALCRLLAFWCNGNADRIDRLFRRSGLMRPKWDEARGAATYGSRTISVVLTR